MAADPSTPAILASTMPCFTRRMLGAAGTTTDFAAYGFFPWKGQNIDTPRDHATKWTTDDDVHP